MTDKIKIEELAAYLAWELRVGISFPSGDEFGLLKSVGLHPYDGTEERVTVFINTEKEQGRQIILAKNKKWIIKPLVLPLSELNNTPAKEEIFKECDILLDDKTLIDITEYGKYLRLMDCHKALQVLFRHHFDVFNWLERGLALNKNDYGK